MSFVKNPSKEMFQYPFEAITEDFVGDYYSPQNILCSIPGENMRRLLEDPGDFPNNIQEFIFGKEGENDEEDWVLLAKLDNGNYAFFIAWCDYTGFDTQGGMKLYVAENKQKLVDMAMDEKTRRAYLKFFPKN